MVLIHSYGYGSYGIGDMIRSMLAYYTYCSINKIDYYIDFSETLLKYCFDNKVYEIKDSELTNVFTDFDSFSEKTKTILYEIKMNKEKNYYIYSNTFNFLHVDLLNKNKKNFSNFLIFSDLVKERAKELLNEVGLTSEYICIHVRCGDHYYLKDKLSEFSSQDIRISPEQALVKIKKVLKGLKNLSIAKKVLIITDNKQLKEMVKMIRDSSFDNTYTLNTDIYHIAIKPEQVSESETEIIRPYLDSIAEFYILTKSSKNICLSPSGFSYWASYIYDVPMMLDL